MTKLDICPSIILLVHSILRILRYTMKLKLTAVQGHHLDSAKYFVIIHYATQQFTTKTMKSSKEPVWNQSFFVKPGKDMDIIWEVWKQAKSGNLRMISRFLLSASDLESGNNQYKLPSGNMKLPLDNSIKGPLYNAEGTRSFLEVRVERIESNPIQTGKGATEAIPFNVPQVDAEDSKAKGNNEEAEQPNTKEKSKKSESKSKKETVNDSTASHAIETNEAVEFNTASLKADQHDDNPEDANDTNNQEEPNQSKERLSSSREDKALSERDRYSKSRRKPESIKGCREYKPGPSGHWKERALRKYNLF